MARMGDMVVEDTSLLIPGETECPHCGYTICWPPRLATTPGNWVTRHHVCPECRNDWAEIRDVVTVTRYWTPTQVLRSAQAAARSQ